MAIATRKRRVVAARVETTRGTQNAPVATTDAVPMIRDADVLIKPISIERKTLRLSMTTPADIFPGKATVEIDVDYEMTANSTFTGDASAAEIPLFYRMIRGCAFDTTAFGAGTSLKGYKVSSINTDNGPLRHDETVTGTGVISGNGWKVYGDCFADDGLVFVIPGAAGTLSGTTLSSARGSFETVFNIVSTAGPIVFGWDPQSDVNLQDTLSLDVYLDGKRVRSKGCMGNTEFKFTYGDAVVASSKFQGVFVDYTDTAMPATPNEAHKYPPTFLGPRITIRKAKNVPATSEKYGTAGGAGGAITGALTEVALNTGNNVILRPNAIDPNGVAFALVTGRAPSGTFNPDEVASTEFDWYSYFVAGLPIRMKIEVVGPDATSVVFDDPNSANQNIYDWITPGLVMSGLEDADREGINTWNGSFKMSGGDYDSSTSGELVGNDNEFVIVHR